MNAPHSLQRTFDNPQKKERTTIVNTSTETGGEYTLLRIELGPGGGVEEHFHHHRHETFEVVEGTLDLTLDGKLARMGPGEIAECPAGTVHSFWNRAEQPVVFEAKITPGHTAFENLLRVSAGLARDGLMSPTGVPKGFAIMSLMSEWSETQLPGLMWRVIQRVLRWGYQRATRRGLDRELLKRYGGELT